MTIKMKILLLDNYDSFTYNLLHAVKELGATDVEVVRNDQIELDEVDRFDKIILSPGPGIPGRGRTAVAYYQKICSRPKAFWVSASDIRPSARLSEHDWRISKRYITVYRLRSPSYDKMCLFEGLGKEIPVGRYHSWVVSREGFSRLLWK